MTAGCTFSSPPAETITLATTTSTQDTGLLEELVPMFRRQTGIEIKVVAVGSGQALELGRRGDTDVLLVHAPLAEEAFIVDGHGVDRRSVMHNDFVLLGVTGLPASITKQDPITAVFAQIARSKLPFVSRGDRSGTHQKEKQIWREAGIEPKGEWYLQVGTGMTQALRIADQKRTYILADRGTFLAQQRHLDLKVVTEGSPLLLNPYSVIVVNPAKHPHIRYEAAGKFADFLLTPEVQKVIAEFGISKYGQPLFFPH